MAATIYDDNDNYETRLAKYDEFREAIQNALLTLCVTIIKGYNRQESKGCNDEKQLPMTRNQLTPITTNFTTTTTISTTRSINSTTISSNKQNFNDGSDNDDLNNDNT